MRIRRLILATLVAVLAGCGSQTVTPIGTTTKPPATTTSRTPAPTPSRSGSVVPVAPPGVLPNAVRTPGAVSPEVTPATIHQTICVRGWTATVRPRPNYTTALKIHQLQTGYAYRGDMDTRHYEEDHLIPLELGGSPTSVDNLWPEPYTTATTTNQDGARTKDKLEDALRRKVCAGELGLRAAQHAIATNWWDAYNTYVLGRLAGDLTQCLLSAPTTAAGFTALWNAIPRDQWGAADGSMSFKVTKDASNRVVWLYGDTWAQGNPRDQFTHSSAIIQTRGCVHVSYGGGVAVLPDDVTDAIDSVTGVHYDIGYWIETAYNSSRNYLHVVARRMRINVGGTFQDLGTDRTALVQITSYDNARFVRWLSSTASPAKPGVFAQCFGAPVEHRYCYNPAPHPEQRMASGLILWTVNVAYDDGVWRGVDAYRPLWGELPKGTTP